MKVLFFGSLFLLSLTGFSQTNEESQKAFEKLPDAMKAEVLQTMLMYAEMEHKDAKITPEITITGQEGFKFRTQNPVVLEEDADEIWKKYKDPNFEKVTSALHPLYSSSTSPIEYRTFTNSNYTFRHYPLGSEFTIKTFIQIGSGWMFILADKEGKNMLVEDEHVLNRMFDGDGSSYSTGRNWMYLYWNSNGKPHQTVTASTWELTGLTRFIEAIKKGDPRTFPVFKDRKIPSPEPKTKGEWINYFLKGTIGKTARISNEKNENHSTIFDIEADTDVLMFLIYAKFVNAHPGTDEYNDFSRTFRFKDQDEARLIANTLHSKRKRSKEEMEEFLRAKEERNKRKSR